MTTSLRVFAKDESGATAIEYGLIAALVAVAAILGMQALGTQLNATFNTVAGELEDGAQPFLQCPRAVQPWVGGGDVGEPGAFVVGEGVRVLP